MEELKTNIKKWLLTEHYNFILPDWVKKEDFFDNLVDKVIEDIEKTGINEREIDISDNILYPLVSANTNITRSKKFVYKFPDTLLDIINSIRKPYRIVYLE